MRYRIIITFLVLLFASTIQAQNERKDIRKGNKAFRQQNYVQAEVDYRKATAKNGRNPQAIYNLGCAFMAQQKDSSAVVQFENASKIETNPKRKAMAFHNIGVIFSEAIEAYKESLRNNPSDNETRYNLELCKRQLKNQKNNNNDKNQQNKNDKNKDNKNKEQQKKDQKDDRDKQQNNQQQPKEQMSKDNAEQLLNAAMQKEEETQDRLKKAMRQSSTRKLERNW